MITVNEKANRRRANSFQVNDDSVGMPASKRIKEMKDSEVSETSSEDMDDDRLQRMAQAVKTIIEVSQIAFNGMTLLT
jgi:hypothetical protein